MSSEFDRTHCRLRRKQPKKFLEQHGKTLETKDYNVCKCALPSAHKEREGRENTGEGTTEEQRK